MSAYFRSNEDTPDVPTAASPQYETLNGILVVDALSAELPSGF